MTDMFDTDLVRVGQSKLCAGLGVFAVKAIKEHVFITRYHGKLCQSHDEAARLDPTLRYNIEYGKEGEILVGESDLAECTNNGVAQLVNDAVSVALTGLYNNCCFVQDESVVWLKSLSPIEKGEELLSGYGNEYWQSETSRSPNLYSKRFHLEILRNSLLTSRLEKKYDLKNLCCSGWSLGKKIRFHCGRRFECPSGLIHENAGGYVGVLKAKPSRNGKHQIDFACDVCGFEDGKIFSMPIMKKLKYAKL